MLVGLISDTHGSMPPSVADAFAGVERIVHAGDVGSQPILDELELIAPVVAVRGNMDAGELEWRLPDTAVARIGGCRLMVCHDLGALRRKGLPADVDVFVSGHTHQTAIERIDDVLFVNPGSAGRPGRDGRGPTVAVLDCAAQPPVARIIDL